MRMRTSHAFIIFISVLTAGFAWTTFFPSAPFTAYSGTMGLAFGAYAGKRLLQKKEEFVERDS